MHVPDNLGIWLINLPKDSKRLEKMQKQLADLGVTATIFPAINGKEQALELKKNVDEAAYTRNMGQSLLPGKMGVYASHVSVWEAFLQSDHDYALILEDDVIFHDDFPTAFQTALDAQQHWDLIRFNCIRAKMPISQGALGAYRLNAYLGPFTGNACYLIKRSVAEKLCTKIWPQTRAMDHELNRFFVHDYRQMGLEPFSSHPDDGGVSTITGREMDQVRKPKWHKRLPHYRLKAANYFRRAWWLMKNGMLLPSHKDLT
ncbi:glycosyltransferase family 25 protein [Shimia sp. R11_0]|uniref:glycosyltransferase family 25 protein n=1 Tax=Shimia sp. R11_0 TaxID=2821096 RepID=UPI001AD9613D|nr:glycosyltransferase family 25 protein [Shimia sp. R11_0]MBO9477021.1 glycosyltransferase family 25 protein [Shimia sp. R11_0]